MNPMEAWLLASLGVLAGYLIGVGSVTGRQKGRPAPSVGLLTADETFDLVARQLPRQWRLELVLDGNRSEQPDRLAVHLQDPRTSAWTYYPIGSGSADGDCVERQVLAALRHAQERAAEAGDG